VLEHTAELRHGVSPALQSIEEIGRRRLLASFARAP
jgi:hypothetical protein